MTISTGSLSFEDREVSNARDRALEKYRGEKEYRFVGAFAIIGFAAVLVFAVAGTLGICMEGDFPFETASFPVSLTIGWMIFMYFERDFFSSEITARERADRHATIWALGCILFFISSFLIYALWGAATRFSLERVIDITCVIPACLFAAKAAVHLAKAVRAGLRARNAEKARPRLKGLIEEVLSQKGRIVFRGTSRRTGAAIMQDGTIRKLDLGEYADMLIKDVQEISPGTCLESVMAEVWQGKEKHPRRWAAAVRRDAKRKCAGLNGPHVLLSIRGRHIIGLKKTGEVFNICFEDDVCSIFDRPEELMDRKQTGGAALLEKLLPVGAIAAIKSYEERQ